MNSAGSKTGIVFSRGAHNCCIEKREKWQKLTLVPKCFLFLSRTPTCFGEQPLLRTLGTRCFLLFLPRIICGRECRIFNVACIGSNVWDYVILYLPPDVSHVEICIIRIFCYIRIGRESAIASRWIQMIERSYAHYTLYTVSSRSGLLNAIL